jgi:hypothetical protein
MPKRPKQEIFKKTAVFLARSKKVPIFVWSTVRQQNGPRVKATKIDCPLTKVMGQSQPIADGSGTKIFQS